MKRFIVFFLLLSITGLLSACATLSKNECLQADWFEIGRRDGAAGKPRAVFQEHIDACQEHGVRANRKAYYAGRDEGLRFYCSEDNGFNLGRRGVRYRLVCPANLESDFLAGYNRGLEIYRFEKKVAALENRLKNIENQIETNEKKLYSDQLTSAQRAKIRADLKYLDIEYRDVVRELNALEKSRPTL